MRSLLDLPHFIIQADVASKIFAALVSAGLIATSRHLLKLFRERRVTACLGHDKYTPADTKDNALSDFKSEVYVPPDCQDNNPAVGEAAINPRSLSAEVDEIIGPPMHGRFTLLLADTGMGKSSFLRNYYLLHWRTRSRRKRFQLILVPLVQPNSTEFIKAVPLQERSRTVLFLDGLDEDNAAIAHLEARFNELVSLAEGFRSVLMSCRTQFLPESADFPQELNIASLGGPMGLEGGPDRKVRRLYLSPFSNRQIQQYLAARFPWWHHPFLRRGAKTAALRFADLMSRPLLLAHIRELALVREAPTHLFQVYEIILDRWLTREAKRRAMTAQKQHLLSFCEKLAGELFSRAVDRIPKGELDVLADQFSVRLNPREVRERALLNHDAGGNWKFAHRSIMEYLIVKHFSEAAEPEQRNNVPWTDQMRSFAREMLVARQCKGLPGADLQRTNLTGADLREMDLCGTDLRGADLRWTTFRKAKLAGSDLTNALLYDADLSSASLNGVRGLTLEQAVSAQSDRWTSWPVMTLSGHLDAVNDVAAVGVRHVVSVSSGRIKVWDLENGRELDSIFTGHSSAINAIAVSRKGKRAICASEDHTLTVWCLGRWKKLNRLKGHSGPVNAVAITSDGQRAVSGSDDHELMVWNLAGGITHFIRGHSDAVLDVAVTQPGKRIVSACADGTLKVWDLESLQLLQTLEGHSGRVNAVAVTQDGSRAVSASSDKMLRVWDLKRGRALLDLRGHLDSVTATALTPSGRHAVSASLDKTLRVWDLENGREVLTLVVDADMIFGLAVTPDGGRVVCGGSDNLVKVWFSKSTPDK